MHYRSSVIIAVTSIALQMGLPAVAGHRHRPQEEQIDAAVKKPYRQELVAFSNPRTSGVKLAGTLTLPRGAGPYPGIVYIAGSGPNTRDEELAHHKLGLVIADALTRAGFAVLRYDKRGTGKSTGHYDDATFVEFADDAAAASAYLTSRAEVSKIGLVGHSEGGTTAAFLAARNKDLTFIVMLAGYTIPGKELVAEQERRVAVVNGESEEQAAVAYRLNLKLYDEIAGARDAADAKLRVNRILADATPPPSKAQADEAILFTELPAMRYVMRFDPTGFLHDVTVPVLALFGTQDVVVPADLNAPALEKALEKNRDVTIRQLPGLNHLFQHAQTGALQEFETIDETVSPEVLGIVSQWIAQHAS